MADARCWGAQAIWNSQPPRPDALARKASVTSGAVHSSRARTEAAAASTTTINPAVILPLSRAARPIIVRRDAKAVNQVSAASASQPVAPVMTAMAAALKCQR